jgi:hypothetical protein
MLRRGTECETDVSFADLFTSHLRGEKAEKLTKASEIGIAFAVTTRALHPIVFDCDFPRHQSCGAAASRTAANLVGPMELRRSFPLSLTLSRDGLFVFWFRQIPHLFYRFCFVRRLVAASDCISQQLLHLLITSRLL